MDIDREAGPERRLKILRISDTLFPLLFGDSASFRVVKNPLPDDAVVIHASFHPEIDKRYVELVIYSSQFKELLEEENVPDADIVLFERVEHKLHLQPSSN